MDEISIKYWSPHGRQEETKFQCGHTEIDLVMRAAQRVDLTNISRCTKLQKLDLSTNMLEKLNLSPISGCTSIQEINLQSNHLTKLDLWPLKDCIELKDLDVSENRLHGLDLTPIFLKTRVRMCEWIHQLLFLQIIFFDTFSQRRISQISFNYLDQMVRAGLFHL